MIIIPENIIRNIVSGILVAIDSDVRTSSKEESILYAIFGELRYGKYSYYDQAVSLFDQSNSKSRKIHTKLAFDTDFSQPPIIYITTGKDAHQLSSIGAHESASVTDSTNQVKRLSSCRFSAESNIVIVSDSMEEVMIMYNVIRAMMLAAVDTISLSGLHNPKMGGADISIDEEMIPKTIFMRTLSFGYEYEVRVPSLTRGKATLVSTISNGLPPDQPEPVDQLTLYNFCDSAVYSRLTQPQIECLRPLVTLQYDRRADYVYPYLYQGYAILGTLDSDVTWELTRTLDPPSGISVTTTAQGAWSDRVNANYQ